MPRWAQLFSEADMTHISSILVASDLSARSDRAVQRAAALARDLKAQLTVLTVIDDALPSDMAQRNAADATARLTSLCAGLPGVGAPRILSELGDPMEVILSHATEADLLILGTHRARSFLGELRETTMQRIVRTTSVPVLVAAERPEGAYQSVLAACDFSPAADAAMALALNMAPAARVTPLHAVHIPYAGRLAKTGPSAALLEQSFVQEIDRDADRWRAASDLPKAVTDALEIVTGAPGPILRARAADGAADLLCLGAHGRVGAARALLGSLANDMMRDPPCDVLIARPH